MSSSTLAGLPASSHAASVITPADLERFLGYPLSEEDLREVLRALAMSEDLLLRDRGRGHVQVFRLFSRSRLVLGRGGSATIRIPDEYVSHEHLELEQHEGCWHCHDMNSTNGSRVAGEAITGWHRLRHGDLIELGSGTRLMFLQARPPRHTPDAAASFLPEAQLTKAERRLLIAMSMPLRSNPYAGPATNLQIAKSLCVSENTIKSQVRTLYRKGGLAGDANARAALAHRGLRLRGENG
jgi:hypothetical protein